MRGMVATSTVAERKSRARNRRRAREMRRAPSAIENEFWLQVRDRKLDGFKFKRQVLIGPFITDFACMEEKLVVEPDSPLHDKAHERAARCISAVAGLSRDALFQ